MKEAFDLIKERLKKAKKIDVCKEMNCGECDSKYRYEFCDTKKQYLTFDKCISIVSEVEAEYGNGWIPCEKELPPQPEENPEFDGKPVELYLVSFKGIKYPWRAFWTGKNFTDGWSIVHPEAWMPLPEGYTVRE